ncbi:MAG: PaaI family thioesterase [Desulfobacterales bacterium]
MTTEGQPVPRPNPEYILELVKTVNDSPFPRHMSMRLASIEYDTAVIELETGNHHLQLYGIVHGGVLATLIDTATFWAAFMRIPEDAGMVNVDLKLNYLKPFESGMLTAEGRAIRSGNRICYAEAHVLNASRDIVAHGTSTLMVMPGKGLKMKSRKFLGEHGPDQPQQVS